MSASDQRAPLRPLPHISKPTRLIVTDSYRDAFREVLATTYFAGFDKGYLDIAAGKLDLEDHLARRMVEADSVTIPWITESFDLHGKTVLEIGCGTGSTTVPMALRAGSMRAYDIGGPSLEAAKERARLLGVHNIEFRCLPLDWLRSDDNVDAFVQGEQRVDAILFIALLEHLTPSERIRSLRAAWKLLAEGGVLVIYETPNRLGYFDWHSFQLPFFHALPDELAIAYARRSPRPFFTISSDGDVVENLYRLGRGVSFHEFELALGLESFEVINDGGSEKLTHRSGLAHLAYDAALDEIFRTQLPQVHPAFARPSLDLILHKRAAMAPSSARSRAPSGARQMTTSAPPEVIRLRQRVDELEGLLESKAGLAKGLMRLSARNLADGVRQARRLRLEIIEHWNRAIGRR